MLRGAARQVAAEAHPDLIRRQVWTRLSFADPPPPFLLNTAAAWSRGLQRTNSIGPDPVAGAAGRGGARGPRDHAAGGRPCREGHRQAARAGQEEVRPDGRGRQRCVSSCPGLCEPGTFWPCACPLRRLFPPRFAAWTNHTGVLDGDELLNLVDWVFESFHPGGEKMSEGQKDLEVASLLKQLDGNGDGAPVLSYQ
eukprot:SAG22_NODE_1376_length_4554_cov_11.791919_4_plen_196_part_00